MRVLQKHDAILNERNNKPKKWIIPINMVLVKWYILGEIFIRKAKLMNKTLKRILTGSVAALMLASVGVASSNNNVVNARHRRTHRVYHASYRGIPAAIRGHYASYKYIRGHIRHDERNLVNLNRSSATLMPKGGSDPFGLSNVRTRKLNENTYLITGHVISVAGQGHGSITVYKHGRRTYMKFSSNLGRRLMNDNYSHKGYSYNFKVINSEF